MDNTSILKEIGNTPLIRLKQASELTQCNIYGKAEYFNPGESVKDRAALFIVENAIKNKQIKKGGIVVINGLEGYALPKHLDRFPYARPNLKQK